MARVTLLVVGRSMRESSHQRLCQRDERVRRLRRIAKTRREEERIRGDQLMKSSDSDVRQLGCHTRQLIEASEIQLFWREHRVAESHERLDSALARTLAWNTG